LKLRRLFLFITLCSSITFAISQPYAGLVGLVALVVKNCRVPTNIVFVEVTREAGKVREQLHQ
jgi:hypothetical protein